MKSSLTALVIKEIRTLMGRYIGWLIPLIYFISLLFVQFTTDSALSLVEWSTFFSLQFFLLMIFMPALVMGSWSNEFHLGIERLLFSYPISSKKIIFAKWLAPALLSIVMIILSLISVVPSFFLGSIRVDLLLNGVVFSILTASIYISITLFFSALIKNRILVLIFSWTISAPFQFLPFLLPQIQKKALLGLFSINNLFSAIIIILFFCLLAYNVIEMKRRGSFKSPFLKRLENLFLTGCLILLLLIFNEVNIDIDITTASIHSPEKITKDLIKDQSEPIRITWYREGNVETVGVNSLSIEHFLNSLSRIGKSDIVLYRPVITETLRNNLMDQGIPFYQDRNSNEESLICSAIKIEWKTNSIIIPFLFDSSLFEEQFYGALQSFVDGERASCAIIIGDNNYSIENNYTAMYQALSEYYQVYTMKNVPQLPTELDMVIVVGHQNLTELDVENLRDYQLNGGSVLYNISVVGINPVESDFLVPKVESPLLDMLALEGIYIEPTLIVDDKNSLYLQSDDQAAGAFIPYPLWYIPDNHIEHNLPQFSMHWSSPLSYGGNNRLVDTSESSENSFTIPGYSSIAPEVIDALNRQYTTRYNSFIAIEHDGGGKLALLSSEFTLSDFIELSSSEKNMSKLQELSFWLTDNNDMSILRNLYNKANPVPQIDSVKLRKAFSLFIFILILFPLSWIGLWLFQILRKRKVQKQ